MAVGFAAGVALAFVLSGDVLKRAFGALVAALALRELIRLLGQAVERREAAAHPARVWVLLAGLVQGLYASGGPLLVHALSRVQISRSRFRATLMTIWFT